MSLMGPAQLGRSDSIGADLGGGVPAGAIPQFKPPVAPARQEPAMATPTCYVPGVTVPLWGPGWLSDPLQLSFEFDDVLGVADPLPPPLRDSSAEPAELAPVLRSSGQLSGALIVSLPEGSARVPHRGITLTLSTELHALQGGQRRSYPLHSLELPLLDGGAVSEETRLPFAFDLDELKLPDTFLGTSFHIAHELSCSVARPWYTFAIWTKMSLVLLARVDSPMSSLPAVRAPPSSTPAAAGVRAAAATPKSPLARIDHHGVKLEVGGVGYRLDCTNGLSGGELPGGLFEGTLAVEGERAEGEPAPQLLAVLQRIETLRPVKPAEADGEEAKVEVDVNSKSTVEVVVLEELLTDGGDALGAGRYAVVFSCKPKPLQQPAPPADGVFGDEPPPLMRVLPPPLPASTFKNSEAGPDAVGEYAARYVLRLRARLPAKDGVEPPPTTSVPMALTIFA